MKKHTQIVVIDDEKSLTSLLVEILSLEGYEVKGFNNSTEALEYCQDHCADVDLIITDQTMPDMSGRQLAQYVLAKRPDMPIILCTGYSNQINEEQALGMGIKAYFDKPLNLGKLTQKVEELLAA